MPILTNYEVTYLAQEIIKLSRLERWREADRHMASYTPKWKKGLETRFNDQEKEVNANIDYFLLPFYPDNLKGVHWTVIHKAVDDLLFDSAKWNLIFEEFGQLMLPGIIGDAGQRGLNSVIVGISFNVSNPRVQEFIDKKKFKFAQEVNQTTLDRLRQELRQGTIDGESIPELRGRVKQVFDEARTWRADMIARTETGGAYNYGSFEGYRQSGVVIRKGWLSSHDSKVRDSHRALDGQEVPLEARFSNNLKYPGDPDGPPEEIISCRCSIYPVVEEE